MPVSNASIAVSLLTCCMAPRADQLKLHEIDPALVRAELERAGFQVVRFDDPFVKWRPGVGNTRASATDLWIQRSTAAAIVKDNRMVAFRIASCGGRCLPIQTRAAK